MRQTRRKTLTARFARRHARTICLFLSALILLSALSGCAPEEKDDDERFVLRAAVCGAVESLDPAMNTDEDVENVLCAVYENLMKVEDDGEGNLTVVPGIAKEYTETVNFDGTVEYAFTLRSSARWSDGSRVKARDFAFAWRRLVDPLTNSPNHAVLSMVQGYDAVRETGEITRLGVKADGDSVFRVTLNRPCAYFISEVCTAAATMPLHSEELRDVPDWCTSPSMLCNGPFKLTTWAKGEFLQLRRNNSYYDSRAVTPDILHLTLADAEEAERLFEEGRLDFAWVRAAEEGDAYIPLRSTVCVLYNHLNEVFSRAGVRRAFDLSLDRAALAAAAGGMTPASGLVPEGVIDASAEGADFRSTGGELCAVDDEGYSLRVLDAESELRNSGYWGAVGFPSVTCIYVEEDGTRAAAEAAAETWRTQLKIDASAEAVEREEFERRLSEGEYDAAVTVLRARSADALEYLSPFAGTDGNNALHYVSTPFDLLIGVAQGSADPAARAAFLHDAETLLLRDAALSPLYFGSKPYRLAEGLEGLKHDLRGNIRLDAVHQSAAE